MDLKLLADALETALAPVTAVPVAREVVDRAERIRLSERDSARVLELLENPPKPAKCCWLPPSREVTGTIDWRG